MGKNASALRSPFNVPTSVLTFYIHCSLLNSIARYMTPWEASLFPFPATAQRQPNGASESLGLEKLSFSAPVFREVRNGNVPNRVPPGAL